MKFSLIFKNSQQKVQTLRSTEVNAKPTLTRGLLWLMTITTGIVVGNNYYNQPLLSLMAKDFSVSETQISLIAMLTQIGFALGLLLIVPLGDMVRRKKLILWVFVAMILALFGMVLAPNLPLLYFASFSIGFSSVVPQMFVPLTAELATDDKRSAAIGMVMSGLLLGILLSRVIAGFIGDLWGWKMVYYMAIGAMFILMVLLTVKLPDIKPNFEGNYGQLLRSLAHLIRTQPILRLAAFRGALAFAGFSGLWITLVFHLENEPFHAGAAIAGAFGVVGAAGALAASMVGRVQKKFSNQTVISASIYLMILSWFIFLFMGYTYLGLILGIICLDLGLQAMHISNQSSFFALNIGATNRLNTVYMFSYFLGGSLGTYWASLAWKYFQWEGVVWTGLVCTILVLIAHKRFGKKS
ncbi:MFS transporter [Myroides sp. WP-1]|uniref:MFS transporter n=1 Tax=Myroides sp. WP-1 TaxID=2759944 RepID=UPI0015FE1CDD|nr:MFS transporter [Myroides sp. WP-1]MBB1139127.1 MFS transporter [Myroides sp. WP-1]